MKPHQFSEAEVLRQFDNALRRTKTWTGPRVGLGTIIHYAKQGGHTPPNKSGTAVHGQPFDLNAAIPVYSPAGMGPRDFAGPPLGGAYLFPMNAVSLLVALGGVGKTTAMMKFAAHIAAGKSWGAHPLNSRRVLILCIEESTDELNRKYGAAVHTWTDDERENAEENLRLISCLQLDARLTKATGRQVDVTDFNQHIIEAALEFGAEVIVLDHLQGFASGDLNTSDTATALARASNAIVAQTGAAVILTAHVSKGNIGAQSVLDGFTTGSLAFENAARQVTGVIPLPDDDAKEHALDPSQFLRMEMPKNSYGPSRQRGYLQKVHVPAFHTMTVEPYSPPFSPPIRTASERLKDVLADFVRDNLGTTQNKLDNLSGKAGRFGTTKQHVREAMKELLAERRVVLKPVTKEDRELGLPHQAKQVYQHVD
jgi:hypothetical protein